MIDTMFYYPKVDATCKSKTNLQNRFSRTIFFFFKEQTKQMCRTLDIILKMKVEKKKQAYNKSAPSQMSIKQATGHLLTWQQTIFSRIQQ